MGPIVQNVASPSHGCHVHVFIVAEEATDLKLSLSGATLDVRQPGDLINHPAILPSA